MFNFKRTEAAELHPMELALLGTGEVTLNAVAAELKMLADAGYIVFDVGNAAEKAVSFRLSIRHTTTYSSTVFSIRQRKFPWTRFQ